MICELTQTSEKMIAIRYIVECKKCGKIYNTTVNRQCPSCKTKVKKF